MFILLDNSSIVSPGSTDWLKWLSLALLVSNYDRRYDQISVPFPAELKADYPADDFEAECKAFMCGCDSKGSECFAANRPTFDDKYKDFPQLFCW